MVTWPTSSNLRWASITWGTLRALAWLQVLGAIAAAVIVAADSGVGSGRVFIAIGVLAGGATAAALSAWLSYSLQALVGIWQTVSESTDGELDEAES